MRAHHTRATMPGLRSRWEGSRREQKGKGEKDTQSEISTDTNMNTRTKRTYTHTPLHDCDCCVVFGCRTDRVGLGDGAKPCTKDPQCQHACAHHSISSCTLLHLHGRQTKMGCAAFLLSMQRSK